MAVDGGRTNVLSKSAQSPGKETESTKKSMSRSVSNNDVTRHGVLVNINPSTQESEKGQSLSSGKIGLQFKFRTSRATQRSRISKKQNK